MVNIRKYTHQDPIDFLVYSRFPLSGMTDDSIFDRRSRKTGRQSGKQLEEAAAYRRKLSALPPEKIEQLAADQRARIAEAAKQKAEQEEQARPFNQPAADADFSHWAKMSYWTLEECVALSLGKNPKMVSWPAIQSLTRVSPFASEYASRREIVTRAETMGQLWQSTIPGVFLAWAERMHISVPAELVETVKGLGIQISDWKTYYDQQKALAESKQKELEEERATRLAAMEKHSEFIAEMREQHNELSKGSDELHAAKDKLIAKLRERISQLESVPPVQAEKSLGTRERESLVKLVIGMAINGYAHDPKARRNSTAREIAGDLQLTGLPLDEDTIRKYLSEGRELLPGDETK